MPQTHLYVRTSAAPIIIITGIRQTSKYLYKVRAEHVGITSYKAIPLGVCSLALSLSLSLYLSLSIYVYIYIYIYVHISIYKEHDCHNYTFA